MLKANLVKQLSTVLIKQGYLVENLLGLERPANPEFGDYATNISFLLAKSLRKSPKQIAEEMAQVLNEQLGSQYKFTAINGFINLQFNTAQLWQEFNQLFIKKPDFPVFGKKILLEYVSANPTGPLHIGHGRWAAIGSVLKSLFTFIQAEISTEFYINDAGNQINNLHKTMEAVRNGQPIPEDGYHGDYILELAKQPGNPLELIIQQQRQVLNKFRVEFDCWFYETTLHKQNVIQQAIELLKTNGLAYEKDGALWFQSTNYGDDKDRVLIKEDGNLTYFAVDLAYHLNKIARGFTYLVNIWGADHHGYVARIKSAVKAATAGKFDADNDFKIIIGQLVSLYRDGEPVRMSKRTGEMITLDEVIDEIGVDAARFFLIHKNQDVHLDFDLELAKKQSTENPVYYVQYAHARICSILSKLPENITAPTDISTLEFAKQERTLIWQTMQLYEEIYEAAITFSPYKIAIYALDLARNFHSFYENCPILNAVPGDQQKRYFIIKQVQQTLCTCLDLLGISAPQKM